MGEDLNLVALRPQEIGLFLDVDGTLLDLAPHPDAVEVPEGLIDALARTERCLGGALALISGRRIGDLDRLFAPLKLRASGVHGAEFRGAPDAVGEVPPAPRIPQAVSSELARLLTRFAGCFAEDKQASLAVHYRAAPCSAGDLAAALAQFTTQFAELGLKLTAGRLVFEIQLPGFDKGKAIERFMATTPFLARRPVFIADDAMDRAGFDTALAQGGLAYSVGGEFPGLSGSFPHPAAVRAWLARFGG
jgi:trehalose 6-phosphate phosphatase